MVLGVVVKNIWNVLLQIGVQLTENIREPLRLLLNKSERLKAPKAEQANIPLLWASKSKDSSKDWGPSNVLYRRNFTARKVFPCRSKPF